MNPYWSSQTRVRLVGVVLGAAGVSFVVVGGCATLVGIDDKSAAPAVAADAEPQPDAGSVPPARPDAAVDASSSSTTVTLASRYVYWGTINKDEVFDESYWRNLGHNLDGECTSLDWSQSDTSSICKRRPGAPTNALEDGHLCRDNALGSFLSTVVRFAPNNPESDFRKGSNLGTRSILVLQLLDVDTRSADDAYVPGRLYATVPVSESETEKYMDWTGTDEVVIESDTLIGDDVLRPKVQFPNGYIRNHVWVSGDFAVHQRLDLPVAFLGESGSVVAEAATFEVGLDGSNSVAKYGQVSVVFDIQKLIEVMQGPLLQATNCNASLVKIGMDSLLATQDLHSNWFVGGNAPCDLISFGFGVDWRRVREPVLIGHKEPESFSCDAGSDK